MLNKRPIFIVGLSRGGSSILLNIFRSHPDVCSPRGETQQVFHGSGREPTLTRLAKTMRYLPIVVRQREDVFSMSKLELRRRLSRASRERIDRILFEEKAKATGITQNRYKFEGVEYDPDEIVASRLLCKNLDALAFTTEMFAEMYPDATFFGLVRNGLAVCESHVRRGGSPDAYGRLYAAAVSQIITDADRMSNFHVVRYETLTSKTLESISELYGQSGLDQTLVKKYRLVVGDGGHTGGGAERLEWFAPDDFANVIAPRFDDEQIEKLPTQAREVFLRHARESMERLGYL